MPYTQTVFALDGVAASKTEQMPMPAFAAHRGGWTATRRHTLTPSAKRLPDDVWDEYRFECETRDRLHLPEVSLAEFRDLRDWNDYIEEQEDDDNRITEPDTDSPLYGIVAARAH
ncbi:MAG: hypothetical protein M3Y58_22580 [Chloroflexota bacterium]|nr:hypothetical protein [Chloroflexota bacterium]